MGEKVSHFSEMSNKTVSSIRYMTYELYIKRPMQMVDLKLNMIVDEHPQLINALNRSVNYPLFREISHIPMIS